MKMRWRSRRYQILSVRTHVFVMRLDWCDSDTLHKIEDEEQECAVIVDTSRTRLAVLPGPGR